MRFANYTAGDEVPTMVGDDRWVGYNSRLSPAVLGPGMLASAVNVRMRTGQPTTRPGVTRPTWAHLINEYGLPRPWGQFKAAANFRNPDRTAWLVFADTTGIWRIAPNNQPLPVSVPSYAGIPAEISLTQAFNRLFLFRGQSLRPLVLADLDLGFADVIPLWDATVAYSAGDLVMWGPWVTIGAGNLSCSGVAATLVYPAPHGLVDGADVTVRGADQTQYNGRWKVTVVNDNTVTWTLQCTPSASPATGTITASAQTYGWQANSGTSAGDEPGVTGWTRNYTVLPNGLNAAYLNNRLFVPTAYVPGATASVTGTQSNKADYLAATDVLDYRQFHLNSEFRINQGSSDELMCVVKGSNSALVAFKTESVYLLVGVSGDLSALTLLEMKGNYGIVNGRAVTSVGKDLIFVSPKRGVVQLLQSETGDLQGADVPLSQAIDPDIARIAWQFGHRVRVAWWDNKLYVAVPLDLGRAYGATRIPTNVVNINLTDTTHLYLYLDTINLPGALVQGQRYLWEPGSNPTEVLVVCGTPQSTNTEFVYDGGAIWLRWDASTNMATATSRLRPVFQGVNNAVLVYDFQLQQWQSIDSGDGICPMEFVVANIQGRDRLVAFMADGTVAVYESSDDGDVQLNGTQTPIASAVTTRGYSPQPGIWRSRRVNVTVGTWAARWGLEVVTDGVNESHRLLTDVAPDRTRFERPPCATPFDPTAAGADFDQPFRQDYSEVGNDLVGWDVAAAGFWADRRQVFQHQVRIPGRSGEVTQLRWTNNDGVAELRSVAFELAQTNRREGKKT